MKRTDKYFFETFVIGLILVLLPSRSLGYIVPFVCLAWYMIRSYSGSVFKKTVLLTVVFGLLVAFYRLFYESLVGIDYLVSNSFISFITYGSFVFILLVRGSFFSAEYPYQKYASVLSFTVLIQGAIGIFQFFVVTLTGRFAILPGDAVQGTIGLFAFINENAGFGNQMFAINMVFFLVVLAPYALIHRKGLLSILVGLFSLMLAGVLHVFIGLLFSLLVILFFFRRNLLFSNLGRLVLAAALVGLLIVPLGLVFPGIFRTAQVYIALYQDQDSPKFQSLQRGIGDMPKKYPYVYLIGLGPGQFTSRAGLISSGKYLDQRIGLLSNTVSKPLKEYALNIWRAYSSNDDRFGNSSMHRPYFSLLSLFTEFGLIGLLILLGLIISWIVKMRRVYLNCRKRGDHLSAYLAFSVGLLLIFLIAISFFDNYLETTQAIFPGLMLLSAFYGSLRATEPPDTPLDKAERRPPQLSRA
ncbi:MAG: hypothetical protein WA960_09865 [Tunicatimonas sp.]